MNKKFTLFSMCLLLFCSVQSQELLSSSGACFKVGSYQLDWSIGEAISTTESVGEYTLSQGFQQSTYNVTAINDINGEKFDISIFPNPTSDVVNLIVKTLDKNDIEYFVTDLNGVVLFAGEVINDIEELNFTALKSGIYFLNIKQKNTMVTTIKVIKR